MDSVALSSLSFFFFLFTMFKIPKREGIEKKRLRKHIHTSTKTGSKSVTHTVGNKYKQRFQKVLDEKPTMPVKLSLQP